MQAGHAGFSNGGKCSPAKGGAHFVDPARDVSLNGVKERMGDVSWEYVSCGPSVVGSGDFEAFQHQD